MTLLQEQTYAKHKAIYEWRKANPNTHWTKACKLFGMSLNGTKRVYSRFAAHLITGEPYFKEHPRKKKTTPTEEKPVKFGRKLANPDAEWARLGVRF